MKNVSLNIIVGATFFAAISAIVYLAAKFLAIGFLQAFACMIMVVAILFGCWAIGDMILETFVRREW